MLQWDRTRNPCVAWRVLNHQGSPQNKLCRGDFFFLEFINRRDRNNDGCSMGLRGEGVQAIMSSGRMELGDTDTEKEGKQEEEDVEN